MIIHNKRFTHVIVLLGFALILTACGGTAATPFPTFTPIFDQSPTPIPLNKENCAKSAVENWLQRSSSLTVEFAEIVNSSIATPPTEMPKVIERLITIRGAMLAIPHPSCADTHYFQLDAMTEEVIRMLDGYSRGGQIDMVGFITSTNTKFDELRRAEADLGAIYKTLTE